MPGIPDWPTAFVVAIALVAGMFAIRGSVRLDVNECLRDRRKRFLARARNACPHSYMARGEDGRHAIKPAFVSPAGTAQWICERCQSAVHDVSPWKEGLAYYLRHPEAFRKAEREFERNLRKVH